MGQTNLPDRDCLINVTAEGIGEEKERRWVAGMHFGALRLGQAPPCWPPKQLTLHHQPAPPTHAPPSAQDADAPGRQGWKSVDLMRARDSHWVEETTLSPEPTQEPL